MSTKIDARQVVLRPAQAMFGTAVNTQLDSVFTVLNDEITKLYADRNAILAEGGMVSVDALATTVSFSAALKLHVNSLVGGGAPKVIDLTAASRAFSADGAMLYAVVNRTAGTAAVTADAMTLPATVAANQEVFLIAKRIGTSIHFRDGSVTSAGQSSPLGQNVPDLLVNKTLQFLREAVATDTSTTGNNTTLTSAVTGVVRLTDVSLLSVSGIPAGVSGQSIRIENQTGNQITINNNEVTASAGARIFTGSGANAAMPANATFMFTYDSVIGYWMLTGGSGSGTGGGSKNYLSTYLNNPGNGDFETASVAGWSKHNSTLDSVSKLPNQASGAWTTASTNMTLSAVTAGKLAGNYSGQIDSSSASVAGDMFVSDVFTIDREDQNKILSFKLAYEITAGAASLNLSGTLTNSLAVAIYDVTKGTWLQPQGVFNFIQGYGVGYATGSIQATLGSSQYRFAIYFPNASTGAFTMLIDDIKFGPNTTQSGSIRGPVGSVISMAGVVAPQGYIFADGSAHSRSLYSKLFSVIGTTYGAGDGSTTFNLPNLQGIFVRGTGAQIIGGQYYGGLAMGQVTQDQFQGHSHITALNYGNGVSYNGWPSYGGLLGIQGAAQASNNGAGSTSQPINNGTGGGAVRYGNETFPVNMALAYFICYDDGGAEVSESSATGPVAFFATGSGTGSGGTYQKVNLVASTDTSGTFANNEWKIPVSGLYDVNLTGRFSAFAGAANNAYLAIYLDGVLALSSEGSTQNNGTTGAIAAILDLKAGQILSAYWFTETGNNNPPNNINLSAHRIPGTNQGGSTQPFIGCRVGGSTSTVTNTATTKIIYNVKAFDTDSLYNPATGDVTIRSAGKYQVFARYEVQYGASIPTEGPQLNITHNNIIVASAMWPCKSTAAMRHPVEASDLIDCNVGDTVNFYADEQSIAGPQALINSPVLTYFYIVKVG